MIALLVMTDGRETIFETIPSAEANLSGKISERWIHDDSGDPRYRARLEAAFPGYRIISTPLGRSGFGGAIRSAWAELRSSSSARYVFHLEDDFLFRRLVDLGELSFVLDVRPELVQLALRRQPWNDAERAAGGIVEQHPDDYVERSVWAPWWEIEEPSRRLHWLEHRRFFTTNPTLYRRELLLRHEWPAGAESEGRFSIELAASDPNLRFAFFGARDSGEWVEHIGHERVGKGY